jgi:proliferating cell nuclear antigen
MSSTMACNNNSSATYIEERFSSAISVNVDHPPPPPPPVNNTASAFFSTIHEKFDKVDREEDAFVDRVDRAAAAVDDDVPFPAAPADGVDKCLTRVDKSLTGADKSLTGVDKSLTGVDKCLTGVDGVSGTAEGAAARPYVGSSSNVMELKTVQSVAFKTLMEALKELLNDTCIEISETGLKIIAVDQTRIVLVHLRLDANKFEYFHCHGKIVIGVNMLNLHKLIKTINSSDTLTLFMDRNDMNHLGIKIENGEKNTKTVYKLNLLDLDPENISIDPAEFNSVITMPSNDFQKICRDMYNVADYVEIKNINTQLIFACKGEFCLQETIISDSKATGGTNSIVSANANEIVQGIFNLKYLVLFTKCTNLCNTVELYLKNDYALIIKYSVASLGEIKLCLAPQTEE